MTTALSRQVAAELLGSILLTGTVIGSGILASRLAGGNDALAQQAVEQLRPRLATAAR